MSRTPALRGPQSAHCLDRGCMRTGSAVAQLLCNQCPELVLALVAEEGCARTSATERSSHSPTHKPPGWTAPPASRSCAVLSLRHARTAQNDAASLHQRRLAPLAAAADERAHAAPLGARTVRLRLGRDDGVASSAGSAASERERIQKDTPTKRPPPPGRTCRQRCPASLLFDLLSAQRPAWARREKQPKLKSTAALRSGVECRPATHGLNPSCAPKAAPKGTRRSPQNERTRASPCLACVPSARQQGPSETPPQTR